MKYALMVYPEKNSSWRNGKYYDPQTDVNIGDYIQSIAARQFLPSVDVFIDREEIKTYSGSQVKMIMNGWWRIFDGNEVVSPNILPFYTSYHIAYPEEVTETTFNDLKKYEPIGCRDFATTQFLKKHGVKAYFSGCLTLTLGKNYRVPDEQRTQEVIFSDFDTKLLHSDRNVFDFFKSNSHSGKRQRKNHNLIHYTISQFLRDVDPKDIVELRHSMPLRDQPHEKHFEIAEEYVKRYARARMVITSRIHSALPCLGLGTPVLLVFPEYDALRYEGLIDLINYIGIREDKLISNYCIRKTKSFETERETLVLINSSNYLDYAKRLTDDVASFIKSEK